MPNIKKIKINDIVYDIVVETEASVSSASTKPVQSKAVAEYVNEAMAAKSQVQFITWEAND